MLVNRAYQTRYSGNRIRRMMQLEGLTLPIRRHRRSGRAHTGLVRRPHSNERWCSDVLQIACWNGEVVYLATALDCADREILAWRAADHPLVGGDIQALLQIAVARRIGDRASGASAAVADGQWFDPYRGRDRVVCGATGPHAHHDPGVQPAVERDGRGLGGHAASGLLGWG